MFVDTEVVLAIIASIMIKIGEYIRVLNCSGMINIISMTMKLRGDCK